VLYSEDFQQCNSFSEQAKSLRVAVRAAILAYEKSGRMLDPALVYAAHGFPVFPLTIDKTPVPKRDVDANGKPIPGTGSFKKATCDPLVIRKWWTNHEYLIGLPMGKTSGIWCLDVDSPEDHADGVANWNAVAAQHEPIVTREHRSATGGPHLIFNWHEAQPIYCGLGSLPKKGISVKGEGSYIVVPPSRRKGRSYTIFSDIDPIDTPSWLSEQILQGRSRFDQVYTGPGTADLDKLAEALAFIPNDDLEWDDWTAMALRIYAATAGEGFELFDEWSFKSIKYDAEKTLERWEGIQSSPPSRTGAEKIFKMAREYGWVDKTTPTYSADALSSADAVRDEMRQQVREFLSCVGVPENLRNVWIDFYFSNRPEIARAMLVPTGVGKTRITVEELAEWVRAMGAVDMLIYMVPTHRLGEEIVALFAKHGLSAKVYRGRNAINPETLDPALNPKDPQQKRMCLNLEQVEMAYEAGLDVATSCCLRKAKKGRPGAAANSTTSVAFSNSCGAIRPTSGSLRTRCCSTHRKHLAKISLQSSSMKASGKMACASRRTASP
jgi:hypothetical protein